MHKYATIPASCKNSEFHVVDLTTCGISFMPVFAHTHRSREATSTTDHRHEGFIEVLFCRRGDNTSCECDGKEFTFRPGDVFVAQPEHRHRLKSYPKSLRMYWMWIKLNDGKSQFPHLSATESQHLLKRLRSLPVCFTGGERILNAFKTVWNAYERPSSDKLRKTRLRLDVYNLLLELVEIAGNPLRTYTPSTLDALLAEMQAHPEMQYPVEELAQRIGTNAVRLNHLFKRATGLPPHAYLTAMRIAKAKQLLLSPKLPVANIAYRLGYPTSQYFSTQFREETGQSPRAWRNKFR